MPGKRTPPSPDQIRRNTSRLLGAKAQALKDSKALAALTQPRRKGAQKRTPRPAVSGIRMGS